MTRASPVTIIVSPADLIAKPWPNGKGVTRDVFGKTLPDGKMDWLISIADLTADAEFSYFEGINRVFTLLEGDGIDLVFGDGSPLGCRPFVPVFFSGEAPVRCRVTAASGRAFNVFSRKSGPKFKVSTAMLPENSVLDPGRNPVAVHCAAGSISIGEHALDAGSTIVEPRDEGIAANTAATILIVNVAAAENPAP